MSCSFGVVKEGMMGCVTRGYCLLWFFKYFQGTAPTESYGSAVLFNKVGPFIPPLAIFFPFHKFSCPYGFLFDTSIETMSHCARVIPKACFINCVHCSRLEHMNMKCFVCANWNPCVTWSKEISLSFTWVCTNLCAHTHMKTCPKCHLSWSTVLLPGLGNKLHAVAILHSHISPQLC